MWSVTTSQLRLPFSATARHSVVWSPLRCKNVTGSLARHRQLSNNVPPSFKAGKQSHLGILSVGLLAGGSIAIYLATKKLRKPAEKERSGLDAGMLLSQDSLGNKFAASCHQRETRDEVKESSLGSPGQFEPAIKKARDLLQRAKDEVGTPGIVAAVSVDGKLIWTEGLGYADVENRTPCSPGSVMRIASISKPLTMAAVARLWEEGKLDLDKPVQEYVPSFPEKEWDGEKVTVTTRLLASHLAGIRHYDKTYMNKKKDGNENKADTDEKGDNKKANNVIRLSKEDSKDKGKSERKSESAKERSSEAKTGMKYEASLREMQLNKEFKSVNESLAMFKDDPLTHKPGTKYLYTTHGWTLVSGVVEGASGKDFLTYMTTMLSDMGLKETVPDKHIPIIYNRARGYRYNKNGKLENCPYVDLSYKWGGGGYLSTVADLIKFGNAMLYSYQYFPVHKEQNYLPGFLKQETMQAIWKPIPEARARPTNEYCYALGWMVVDKEQKHGHCRPQRHFVAHSGAAMGFSSILTIAPAPGPPESGSPPTEKNSEQTRRPLNSGEDEAVESQGTLVSPPKGTVVAIIANLLDAGLSKTAERIVEAFQECQDSE